QAIVGDPDLVILDEPMSGLDPLGRRDIRDIMTGLRDRGKTVFFSTHILPDVEMICDKVAIIVGGKSRKLGRLDELLGLSVQGADVLAASCSGRVRDDAAAHSLRVEDRQSAVLFEAASVDDANRIVDLLRGAGVTVLGLQVRRQSLEDLFIDEATGNVDGAAS
ncbi:MAG: ABC transporter ATP-binding protein, partial [Myxococcota bacterium]